MPYSYQGDTEKIAKAYGKELNVSWKGSNEICHAIKGMMVDKAIVYLEKVQKKEDFIPYRRYKKGKSHRTYTKKGVVSGAYPVKASKEIAKLLKHVKANAEHKGLNAEKMKIVHATAHRAMKLQRMRTRSWGGQWPFDLGPYSNITLTNIEIVAKEV